MNKYEKFNIKNNKLLEKLNALIIILRKLGDSCKDIRGKVNTNYQEKMVKSIEEVVST